MSLRSPRSPHRMGFMPLRNQSSNYPEAEIPLTQVRSAASSMGTRMAAMQNQATFHSIDMSDSGEEKKESSGYHGPAGRRRIAKDLHRSGTGSSEELNMMGRIYQKIIGFSVITRYLVYVVPVAILLAVPLIIIPLTRSTNRVQLGPGNTPPSLFLLFVWIEIAWLSLWIAKSVAYLLPPIFMFFCGVISTGTRKYATVLRALEIPLSLFFWGLASWLTFRFILNNNGGAGQWANTLERILLSLFLCSAVLLGEKAIVQLISITYHQRSFANRINDSKREIYLLGLLYEASRALFPMYCPEFAEEDYVINDSIEMMLRGKHGGHHHRGKSVNPMRIIGDVGRIGDKITSVFGNIASEITGKNVFNPNSAHSIVIEALEKVHSSEAMARRIWMSFAVEGRDSLSVEDIIEVLGAAHKEDAEECFAAIDADQNGDISLDEMIRKVVAMGKERKAITNSMKDIGQALSVFDKVLLCVVFIICIIIFLAVFQSSLITTLTTAGTTLLSLSFVFAVTTQEFLGSCIFLFVKHPYDVGDRVDITGSEKEQLIVEKISLLYTVFTRIDKMQVVQVPNITLNNLWIENVTRSKAMKEVLEVNVSFDTSFEDIELLRLEMEKFVRLPENSRDFQPDVGISIGGVGDLDKLKLYIAIKHKSNWHNDGVRASRRSKFICALALAMRHVPIVGPGGGGEPLGGPTNPSYSVAVDDDFAAVARKKAASDTQAARLINQPFSSSSASKKPAAAPSITAEQRAVVEINTRNPVADAEDDWPNYESPGSETTPGSRDISADRRSQAPPQSQFQLQLGQSQSQRGRRKAGEGVPDIIPPTVQRVSSSGIELARAPTTTTGLRTASFDVERQAGRQGQGPSNLNPTAVYTGAAYAAAAQQQQQQASSTYFGGAGGGNSTSNTNLMPTVTGARPRGASVSRSQERSASGSGGGGGNNSTTTQF